MRSNGKVNTGDTIYIQSIKEQHGWYLVDYVPPPPSTRFSTLQFLALEHRSNNEIAESMEREAVQWLERFPIPLLATAFTLSGDVIDLREPKKTSYLMAWKEVDSSVPTLKWDIVPDSELPDVALNRDHLNDMFAGYSSRTGKEISTALNRQLQQARNVRWLLFVWVMAIPLIWAVLEWSSEMLGLLVLLYAFFKAGMYTLRFFGFLPKSKRLIEKEKIYMKTQHYFTTVSVIQKDSSDLNRITLNKIRLLKL